MTIQELFVRSNEELRQVILQIRDTDLELPMPEGSSSQPTTLGESVAYHAYDDAWIPDVLAGKTKEEVGDKFDYLLNSERIKGDYVHFCQVAIDVVGDFTDLDRIVHLSYGDFSAREYLQHITAFRAFRIFDIAKLIGVKLDIAEDYLQALYNEMEPLMDGFRSSGVFGPALDAPEDADVQTKLLAMAGKKW